MTKLCMFSVLNSLVLNRIIHKFSFLQRFSVNSSFLFGQDKQVLDEHRFLLRRIRSESFDLILLTKAPFREIEAVLLFYVGF